MLNYVNRITTAVVVIYTIQQVYGNNTKYDNTLGKRCSFVPLTCVTLQELIPL